MERATQRDVYSVFSRFRQGLEQDLWSYLRALEYIQDPQERLRIAQSFPFREVMANGLESVLAGMNDAENNLHERLRRAFRSEFGEFETALWRKDVHVLRPGWVDDIVSGLDWQRLRAYTTYLRDGAVTWLHRWGSKASAELGAGVVGGEPVSAIVERITGVNIATPDGREALGGQTVRGLLVNTRYAVVEAANEGRSQAYRDLNDQYGLDMERIWVAHVPDCCPICLRLHGTVVDLSTDFPWRAHDHPLPWRNRLAGPPRHPNCRCSLAPWSDNWLGLTEFSPAQMRADAHREMTVRFPHILAQERRV